MTLIPPIKYRLCPKCSGDLMDLNYDRIELDEYTLIIWCIDCGCAFTTALIEKTLIHINTHYIEGLAAEMQPALTQIMLDCAQRSKDFSFYLTGAYSALRSGNFE